MALTLQQMVDEIRPLFEQKLRVRGRSLGAQVRKAGRLLPRSAKRDAHYLAQALALAENPKLARMVDMAKAKQAHRNVMTFLDEIDLGARRGTAALKMITSIVFALLVTGILVLFVLVQRGFL